MPHYELQTTLQCSALRTSETKWRKTHTKNIIRPKSLCGILADFRGGQEMKRTATAEHNNASPQTQRSHIRQQMKQYKNCKKKCTKST